MDILMDKEPGCPIDEEALAADILFKLHLHYPGYNWLVKPDSRKTVGMCYILCGNLPHPWDHIGGRLHLVSLYKDPTRRVAIRCAGELLEAAGFPMRGPGDGTLIEPASDLKGLADA